MKILITGATGFVGQHLIRHLAQEHPDAKIFGTRYSRETSSDIVEDVEYTSIDLTDSNATQALLERIQPDQIYHLAAQSAPSLALQALWQTLEINIRSQLNLLQGCVDLGISPRILVVSSGDVYNKDSDQPITEQVPFCPHNTYALSKITQDMMGLQYYKTYDLPVIRVRPFNHTGSGQRAGFVAPDFALQIARIEAGLQPPIIHVGNLNAERDFSDVRDVVRAYDLLMHDGKAGEVYNVASGEAHSIRYLLDTLCELTDIDITVEVDETRLRPADVPRVVGSYAKLQQTTGWQPTINLETTLNDLLNDCRLRLKQESKESS